MYVCVLGFTCEEYVFLFLIPVFLSRFNSFVFATEGGLGT